MVSICLSTYNGEKYIKQQLESILPQLSSEDEVVISDNYSTDNTVGIIKAFNDKRIKIYYHKQLLPPDNRRSIERNVADNFENALKHCNGDYIFFSDQDDIWLDNKISKMKTYLNTYAFVMCNATLIDGMGNIVCERLYKSDPLKYGIFSFRARGCLSAFRCKVKDMALPFPKSILYHDNWIGILAEFLSSYYFLDESLVLHRRNITNVSTDITQKSKNSFVYKIKYRLILLYHGFTRYLYYKYLVKK